MTKRFLSTILLGLILTNVYPIPANAASEIQIAPAENLAPESTLSVDELISLTREKIAKKDYQGARLEINKAIAIDPQNVELYVIRGGIFIGLQRYDRAINDYDQAIQISPQHKSAFAGRGRAYGLLGQYEKAIKNYSQVIAQDPSYPHIYVERGWMYVLKNDRQAIDDANSALALNPQDYIAYFIRGAAYANIYTRSPLPPTDLTGHLISLLPGLSYREAEEKQKAIDDYDKAIALHPKYALAYHYRGLLYGESYRRHSMKKVFAGHNGDKKKAIDDFGMAAKLFHAEGNQTARMESLKAIEQY
jgi:tetratricopeptide (TPR) repeat protein